MVLSTQHSEVITRSSALIPHSPHLSPGFKNMRSTFNTRSIAFACSLLSCYLLQGIAQAAPIYNAGADLLANEQLNNPSELSSTNFTVPEWSYGHRGTTLGTSLTPFTPADHVNGTYQGFADVNSICCGALPNVIVNTGAPAGAPDGLVATGEITMHPDGTGGFPNAIEEKPVVRFTATLSGEYTLNALFEDVDDCCGGAGQGVDVHVVLNGVSLFDDNISREGSDALPDGTTFSTTLNLTSGDLLDFVVGTNGVLFGDNTRFNAILEFVPVPAPEPSSITLLGLGALVLVRSARRRRAA
jgi:hypothetical protein